jgi:hypothetical protein
MSMATRSLRGALAGAAAAAVWAAQQPLDRRVFGVAYDDTEVLGRWVVPSGGGWQPAGVAFHLVNGAVFGAAYANVAPSLPVPAGLRGPSSTASTRRARTCRSSGAPVARSRRRPGATCCSAPCWASWSGA